MEPLTNKGMIHIRLSEKDKAALRCIAKADNRTLQSFIETALQSLLKKNVAKKYQKDIDTVV
jgi:hypothetical protein